MHLSSLLIPVALAASLGGCVVEDDDDFIGDASLRVINDSDYVIEEIYLTEHDNPDWGPNLLRGDVLLPGEELLLGVQCDFYDALLIDEEGVACEIPSIDLCLNDAEWVIRNNTCIVFEANAEAAPRAATQATQASL